MEDVRIGRKKRTSMRTLLMTGAADILVNADPFRVSLVVGNPDGNGAFIVMEGDAAANRGLRVQDNAYGPLTLTIEEHGDSVTKRWTAQGALNTVVTVMEVFLFET